MKLTFNGAAHEVTGSCHCLEACNKKIIVDCGMEQGRDIYVNEELPFPISQIDYVFLTHAHIDHSGMLPYLYKNGFRGSIFATKATTQLCRIMLKDSAHIQESEAEWKNRKNKRSDAEPVVPVYTIEDAENVLTYFVPCEYEKKIDIAPGIQIRMRDVGHLLGSASIEVWLTEAGRTKKIVFSGDIGNTNQPLIKDPSYVDDADYVVMESTYGNRSHDQGISLLDCKSELKQILKETLAAGGNLVIPCFAVGRTQEILYFLRQLKVDHELPEFEHTEVFVDSPLAVEATNIFMTNTQECFDEEAMALVRQGINPIRFPGLRSLGCVLLGGAKNIRLFGEEICVKARIARMTGISGHADREGLVRWVSHIAPKPTHVFVVHGEDTVTDSFASLLTNTYGINATAPYTGESWDLLSDQKIREGTREYVKKDYQPREGRMSDVYRKLFDAAQQLLAIVKKYREGANKDIRRFTEDIEKLCRRWDK